MLSIHHLRTLSLGAMSLLLAGCPIPEEDFPEAYGTAFCRRFAVCEEDSFETLYDDEIDNCADDIADVIELALNAADLLGQEYDPALGRDCVNDMNFVECGDLELDQIACDVF